MKIVVCFISTVSLLVPPTTLSAQEAYPSSDKHSSNTFLPQVALKTNLIYDLTTTINLAAEIGVGKHTSIDISANYNAWQYNDGNKIKHFVVQPSFRYWFRERFDGWFVGAELHYGIYNVAGFPWLGLSDTRYQGWLVGGGATAGYAWTLGGRWSIEAEVAVGYAHIKYDKYQYSSPCCQEWVESGRFNYVGPTKIALSVVVKL